MDDNLNGALLRVRSALEGVVLEFGALGASQALQGFLDNLAEQLRDITEHLDTAIVFAGSLLLVLSAGKIAAASAALYGMAAALFTVEGAFIAASAAASLFAPLAIALGVTVAIQEYRKLLAVVRETPATFEDAAIVAIDRFVNALFNSVTAIGSVARNLAQAITDPIVLALEHIGEHFIDILFGRTSTSDLSSLADIISTTFFDSLERIPEQFSDRLRQRSIQIASDEQLRLFEPQPVEELPSVTAAALPQIIDQTQGPDLNLETADEASRAQMHARALEEIYNQLVSIGLASRDVALEGELWGARIRESIDITAAGAEQALADVDAVIERFRILQTDDAAGGIAIGLETVSRGIRSVAESTRDATLSAFQTMEDALVNFVRSGELNFSRLIDSILADLARIAIQQSITGPLAAALGGAFGNFFGGTAAVPAGGVNPGQANFVGPPAGAAGGLVRGPGTGTSDSITARVSDGEFLVNAMATRRYLPLLQRINSFQGGGQVRTSGTTVNVINQRNDVSEEDIQVQTRTSGDGEEISILILDTVNAGINSGRFDSAQSSRFGLQPRLR